MYKKGKKKIVQWQIFATEQGYYTISGDVDGKQTTSKETLVKPKNIGKKNETTIAEQIKQEIKAKIEEKRKSGYFDTISEAESSNLFRCSLAEKYEEDSKSIILPLYSSPKMDGVRAIYKDKELISREGNPFFSLPHILNSLAGIAEGIILDGELYNHNYNSDFNKIVALCKKKKTDESFEEQSKIIKYVIFDCFFEEEPDLNYEERLCKLQSIVPLNDSIILLSSERCNTKEEIDEKYKEYMLQGYEGQMLRTNTPYNQGRSCNLLKRKEFVDEEFEIIDILEGEGNRRGIAGKVVIRLSENLVCEASIAGTFEYAGKLLETKHSVLGKKGTVRYQNKTPAGSLRFPIFKGVRDYE